jgi:predicted SAM-dependent methyltransferase
LDRAEARCGILNLGCGKKHVAGAVNVDITSATNPDLVHDLNRTPWPFPDSSFQEVHAFDVLEHLDNMLSVMQEIHRVSHNDAIVRITTPHFSSANSYTDLTHRHHFGYFSLDHFTGDSFNDFYTSSRFRLRSRKVMFQPSFINKFVWRFAERNPRKYEQSWTWAFPAWYLYFELSVLKDTPQQEKASALEEHVCN